MTRSEIMSRIRSSGTKPERMLWSALRRAGMKHRRNAKDLHGKPDAVLRESKTAVFVDGCFWHGCPSHYRRPKTNALFWSDKVAANRNRDTRNNMRLQRDGYRVVRVWECEVRSFDPKSLR